VTSEQIGEPLSAFELAATRRSCADCRGSASGVCTMHNGSGALAAIPATPGPTEREKAAIWDNVEGDATGFDIGPREQAVVTTQPASEQIGEPLSRLREVVSFLRSVIASGERLNPDDNAYIDATLDAARLAAIPATLDVGLRAALLELTVAAEDVGKGPPLDGALVILRVAADNARSALAATPEQGPGLDERLLARAITAWYRTPMTVATNAAIDSARWIIAEYTRLARSTSETDQETP
jgi:hypothetical protein